MTVLGSRSWHCRSPPCRTLRARMRHSNWRRGSGRERLRLNRPYYDVTLLSIAGTSIATLSGFLVDGACPFDQYDGVPDTLLVVEESNSLDPAAQDHPPLLRWVRRVGVQSRRICSICTGIFCLAEAGILDARRVTTHWQYAALLAQKYPAIQVDPEPLFLRDANLYTSAGCTAAMDLSLALIEEDLGASSRVGNCLQFADVPSPAGKPGAGQPIAQASDVRSRTVA